MSFFQHRQSKNNTRAQGADNHFFSSSKSSHLNPRNVLLINAINNGKKEMVEKLLELTSRLDIALSGKDESHYLLIAAQWETENKMHLKNPAENIIQFAMDKVNEKNPPFDFSVMESRKEILAYLLENKKSVFEIQTGNKSREFPQAFADFEKTIDRYQEIVSDSATVIANFRK